MTGEERRIIDGLLAKDYKITKVFFFTKCRPMFHNMIHNIFRDSADYDELVNDLYLHLMEKDGRRLRSFGKNDDTVDNNQNTAYALIKWLRTTAWRYFADIAEKEQSVAERRKFVINEDGEEVDVEIEDKGHKDPSIDIDFNIFFDMIKLERDREVLKKYFIEDLEPDVISEKLGISKENLYNIKKRALTRLQQAARHATSNESLCSIICEQYVLDVFGIHKSLDALQALSKENGWLTETGVTLENIGTICREFGLTVKSQHNGQLNDIEKSIDCGCQVIVAVDGGELTGNQLEEKIEDAIGCQISDHCVVVLAIEEDSVTLYDPSFGYSPLTVNKEHFLDAWEDSNKYYVTIMPEENLSTLFRRLSQNEVIGIDSENSCELPDIDMLPDDIDEVTSDSAETSAETHHINVRAATGDPVNICFFEDGAKKGSSMFVCTLKQKEDDIYNEVDYPLCLAQTVATCCHRDKSGRMGIEKVVSKTYLIMHKRLLERLDNPVGLSLKKSINSVINSGKKDIDLDDIVSFNPDENEYAPTKATQLLRRQEAALIEDMAKSGSINEDNWMVVDGPLSIKEADYQNFNNNAYRYIVGVEKSFHDKYEKRPFAQTINTLQEGYRTPAFIPRSKRGKAKVALWYLRLRRPDRSNDRSHIIACELLIPNDQEKIDTNLINRVSKAILNEAYPLCYGSDERWRTHLYSVFVTEKTCKSLFHSKEILDGLLK